MVSQEISRPREAVDELDAVVRSSPLFDHASSLPGGPIW